MNIITLVDRRICNSDAASLRICNPTFLLLSNAQMPDLEIRRFYAAGSQIPLNIPSLQAFVVRLDLQPTLRKTCCTSFKNLLYEKSIMMQGEKSILMLCKK